MSKESVNQLICGVRQVNGMLQLLDAEKQNRSITLGELQDRFATQYGVHPADKDFAFYNQNQFLISLLAYVCMPSAKFYEELPGTPISSLPPGWGIEDLGFPGSLQQLVRLLRNSISHGSFTVTPELIFEFKDLEKPVVVINSHSLQRFCHALSHWCLTKDATLTYL